MLALQIATDRMKVLPILVEDCTLPLFRADKLFLDMRGWQDPSLFGGGPTRLLGDIDIGGSLPPDGDALSGHPGSALRIRRSAPP